MAKRFTDTEKWSDPWYRKLPVAYKNFWDYLCSRCDNAGVWKVDMEMAQFQMDYPLMADEALRLFEGKVIAINPDYWHIPGFIAFQYGELSPDSKPHQAVARLVQMHQIKGYPKGIHTLKDKEKDKDKDKGESEGIDFDAIWARYPKRKGRKAALRHFNGSVRTQQDWLDIQKALDNYLGEIRRDRIEPQFVKHGSTWFNNWRDDVVYRGVELPKPPPPPPPPPRKLEPPLEPLSEPELLKMHRLTVAMMKGCFTVNCEFCAKIRKLEGVGS